MPPAWGLLAARRKEHIRAFRRSAEYAAWVEAYRRFVRGVVAPLVGDARGVAFQCPPTLRCQLPSVRPLGHRHRDDGYAGHQGGWARESRSSATHRPLLAGGRGRPTALLTVVETPDLAVVERRLIVARLTDF